MNRLQTLFDNKKNNILSVYFTAGYPEKNSTVPIIKALCRGGADLIEVGVPFSDPMADGPVIQSSSTAALRNGITLREILNDVEIARRECPEIPLVLMSYLNPLMQFGFDKLFKRCGEAGIDAMIIPDLPFNEYIEKIKPLSEMYDIPVIMLITPETSEMRLRLIDENCSGFIYMVSSASTTGTKNSFSESQKEYFSKIDSMNLKNPRLIGFGISNKETRAAADRHSSGVIVGSLFIKLLGKHGTDYDSAVSELIETL